jgi:uncharacterized protein with GYD domain
MPIYITRGNYTPQALSNLLAKPQDRSEAVSALLASSGGRLLQMYFTTGDADFLLITEAPSEQEVLSALLAAGSSGAVTNLNTSLAFTTADMAGLFEKARRLAGEYHPPGR